MRNSINRDSVGLLAEGIHSVYNDFNKSDFIDSVIPYLEPLGLFERLDLVRDTLYDYLPNSYERAINILLTSLGPEIDGSDLSSSNGFIILSLTNYVSKYGLDHFDISMNALYEMTKRFTSEGAIRYFIKNQPNKCYIIFEKWVEDENVHVRRLVSEGLRPRLPWAIQLKEFIKDPLPVIPFLDKLKEDKELYVRRSVANNLNDISKDNPQIVIDLLREWVKIETREMKWLIKHGLRTLLKDGHPEALELLGYYNNPKIEVKNFINSPLVILGNRLDINFDIISTSDKSQNIMVDFIIHHKKSNGNLSPKVFKLKSIKIKPGERVNVKKSHIIKKITTRTYYEGGHIVEIQINGKIYSRGDFLLSFS